jgi:NNP family nitrate/nitrite transporter-like MFS transporter
MSPDAGVHAFCGRFEESVGLQGLSFDVRARTPRSFHMSAQSLSSPSEHPGQGRQLALATLAFAACFYAWSLLGPLGPSLQKHLHISDVQLSALVAVPVLLGSLMRIPLGIAADRFGGRRVFCALMAFTVLPLLALANWHDSYEAMLAFGLLLGFAGASFAVGVPFVNRWYGAGRQGVALGVYGMGMGGSVLAALTAPRIAKATSLTVPFLVAAGLMAVTFAVVIALAKDAPGPKRDAAPTVASSLRVFRSSPRAWALTLFYFLSFGGFVSMFLYLPKLLVAVHHLSKTDAASRAAGFALLAVLARPAGGWLSDRIGAERVLKLSFAGTLALAAVLSATYREMGPLTITCLSLGVTFGLGTGAVFKLVAEWFAGQVGAVTGVVGAAGGLGGFFPPLLMAAVKQATGSYTLGFVLLAAVAASALAVLSALQRGRTRHAPAPAVPSTTVG